MVFNCVSKLFFYIAKSKQTTVVGLKLIEMHNKNMIFY